MYLPCVPSSWLGRRRGTRWQHSLGPTRRWLVPAREYHIGRLPTMQVMRRCQQEVTRMVIPTPVHLLRGAQGKHSPLAHHVRTR